VIEFKFYYQFYVITKSYKNCEAYTLNKAFLKAPTSRPLIDYLDSFCENYKAIKVHILKRPG